MNVSDLQFPVVCFNKLGPSTFERAVDLQTIFVAALRQGWFQDLLVFDSSGRKFRVSKVVRSGSVGPFWGFSLFFSRRIRVDLFLEIVSEEASLVELKALVLKDFADWHGWASRGDFPALKNRIAEAPSIPELIRQLTSR